MLIVPFVFIPTTGFTFPNSDTYDIDVDDQARTAFHNEKEFNEEGGM